MFIPGEIVLLAFPFTDATQEKRRPALVVCDANDGDIVCARITTRQHGAPFDVVIDDWSAAGLKAPSEIRIHKLATLDASMVQSRLGALTEKDRRHVGAVLVSLVSAWQTTPAENP